MCRHCASPLYFPECNIIRLYLIRSHFSPFTTSCSLFLSIKSNGDERERDRVKKEHEKMPAFITLSSGLYRKRIFHLEVTIFLCDFFFRVSPFSALFFAVAFSLSISFHFIFPCCFQFEFLRCRLIEFYCMRLVTLSFEGYSFSMSFDSRVPLFSMRYFRRMCCRCFFPLLPQLIPNLSSAFLSASFSQRKIGWWWKQLQKTVKYFDKLVDHTERTKNKRNGRNGRGSARESRERKKGNIVDFIICHG